MLQKHFFEEKGALIPEQSEIIQRIPFYVESGLPTIIPFHRTLLICNVYLEIENSDYSVVGESFDEPIPFTVVNKGFSCYKSTSPYSLNFTNPVIGDSVLVFSKNSFKGHVVLMGYVVQETFDSKI